MNKGAAPRTVVDTNLFVSALISGRGNRAQLLRAWEEGAYQLIASPEWLAEMENVLRRHEIQRRFRVTPREVERLLARIAGQAEAVIPLEFAALPVRCRDAKDDVLLACALGGNAAFLVTGDEDLLVLNGDEGLGTLEIVRVAEFLIRLQR